jgi:hypothetical protein
VFLGDLSNVKFCKSRRINGTAPSGRGTWAGLNVTLPARQKSENAPSQAAPVAAPLRMGGFLLPKNDPESGTKALESEPELSRLEAMGLDVAMALLIVLMGALVYATAGPW